MSDVPIEMRLPEWTREDYSATEPYEWLYQFKDDPQQLAILYGDMLEHAKKLKVPNFPSRWRGYLKQMRDLQAATSKACNTTNFDGQPMQLECGAYICDDTGVWSVDKMGAEHQIISHPIMPVQLIRNVETEEIRTKLAYRRRGVWKTITVGSDILANATKITALSQKDIAITSENCREVVRYISTLKALNEDTIPEISATGHLGWQADGTFAPYCDGIVYDGDNVEYQRIFEGITTPHGSREIWMQLAHETRSGESIPARIALAASFAAPLVQPLNGLPFIVHFWGATGCGKTVGLMLAASVWGNPPVGEYTKTFQATKVAIESMAAFCANLPVLYDELQVMADKQTFDDIIYMLCEGASKGRGTKDGGMQVQKRWCTAILTSGEQTIVQGNSGGGAAARTIDVHFGNKRFFKDGMATSELLRENYGFAGREYVKALSDPELMKELRLVREKYRKELSGTIQDKQVLSASILLAADWLADRVIFHDGLSLQPNDIKGYLITKNEADMQRRCYDWLMGHIASNEARFHKQDNGSQWGVIEGDTIYFLKSVFDVELQKAGFNSSAFLAWAKPKGKIRCEDYGEGSNNRRLTRRKTINGSSAICVALVRNTNEDLEDENGYVRVDNDSDLPFMR